MSQPILVVDAGTSSIRVAVFTADGQPVAEQRRPTPPSVPFAGLVELDGRQLAAVTLELVAEAVEAHGPVAGIGVTNQRASTLVWDRDTGELVGHGIGWQDLRTVGRCLELQAEGFRLVPNATATKAETLLDSADPDRVRDLCVGTVDSWLVWTLSGGSAHVTDASNAATTGLRTLDGLDWDRAILDRLRIRRDSLPEVVDSAGPVAHASAVAGSPPIVAILGDQQASLVGQGCVEAGDAKITFGTGGMLDLCTGTERPANETFSPHGAIPIVTSRIGGRLGWGLEAIMLSAGTAVDWLRDDLSFISSVDQSEELAASCESSDGVVFVPALVGLGAPYWDHGARGALLGLTTGSSAAQVTRAVLEGVANRGVDLVEAVEADAAISLQNLRVDGGMTGNRVFLQALADAAQRPVLVSAQREATALGAALFGSLGLGELDSLESLREMWEPGAEIQPGPPTDRDRWRDALRRAQAWHPELSALSF